MAHFEPVRRLLIIAILAALAAAAAATAGEPPSGWDGVNPFRCELQQAGFEATGPDPAADPYCVEFDKTRQNTTELGVLEFLSKEPERVAAATDKCFYFQSDHWRGSVVQDDGSTKTYEWDGHYFFDKATGDGGTWVSNFNVNGHTEDPSKLPGMPPEWGQYFGPGTGGVITHNAVDAEPRCVERAKAEGDKIYARQPGPAGPGGGARGCVDPAGPAGRRQLGPIRLGMTDRDVRARLGDPVAVRRGFLRYCAVGGGSYLVGQPGDRSGEFGSDPAARTVLLWSNSPRLLPRAKAVRRAKVVARIGRTRVVRVRKRPWLIAGVRGKRVRWVAVRDTRRVRSLKVWLRRTR